MLNIHDFHCNPFGENCYLLWAGGGEGVVIDPGFYDEEEFSAFKAYVGKEKISLKSIWLTHGHFDHIYGVPFVIREYGLPVLMSPEDKAILPDALSMTERFGFRKPDLKFVTEDLLEGEKLTLGENAFQVICTPGHTPGGVCFYDEADKVLFSGDTLFAGSIGRTDHLGGDYDKEIVSVMDKLMGLPGDVDVLPGHGPKTTIAGERTGNPFLQPFNEPEEDSDEGEEEGINIQGPCI